MKYYYCPSIRCIDRQRCLIDDYCLLVSSAAAGEPISLDGHASRAWRLVGQTDTSGDD